MKVIIGADHGGFNYKEDIKRYIEEQGHEIEDVGTNSEDSVDYPDYAANLSKKVIAHNCLGILICGTGIGMSIAANKIPGIRAAVCHNDFTAQMAREHNNANVLCMGERVIDKDTALKLTKIFLETKFAGDSEEGLRHKKRVDKFEEIEKEYSKC